MERARTPRKFRILLPFVLYLGTHWVLGQNHPSEYDVKAAYLLNFGRFMRLQAGAKSAEPDRFNICVLGTDDIAPALDGLAAGEQISGRIVRVQRVRNAAEARSCDVAYLSASEGARLEPELSQLGDSDVLTVSDAPDFLEKGGMVQFVFVARHVRFSVNLDAVHRTHIALSSELLRVALSVSGKPQAEAHP